MSTDVGIDTQSMIYTNNGVILNLEKRNSDILQHG